MDIGERIRTLRESKGWSLARLTQEASVTKSYISNLEHGRSANPTAYALMRLADALGCTIGWLAEGIREGKNEDTHES